MDDDLILIELDHSPIPNNCIRRLDERTVKRDGEIWRVHKNDPDPFPSKPHAHNLETGLKMHLGNGRLFLNVKDTGKSVNRKDLIAIRNQLPGVDLPALEV